MHENLRVSVAVITYNGEKFIEEQLNSILNQTVKPDEIIISDDGSSDKTIETIQRIMEKYSNDEIDIQILTDNPIHGISTNCSWAIQHTSGDIIFISGQDDVWSPDKIEKTIKVYENYRDAKIVIADAFLIDADGEPYQGEFCKGFTASLGMLKNGDVVKVSRSTYIEYAESTPLVSGPVLSLKRDLVDLITPIPPHILEDQWMEFVGLAENGLYYQNEKLTYYRMHDSTTQSADMPLYLRIKKNLNRVKNSYTTPSYAYNYGNAMRIYYDNHPDDFEGRDAAIDTVNHIISIGEREISYMRMGRIKGAYNLSKMYHTDIRYKKTGRQAHIISLLYILMYSKKKRNQDIDIELAKVNA